MNELDRAISSYRSGDYNRAARLAGAVVAKRPDHLRALELLAASSLRAGQLDLGISALERVCALAPTANAWQQLGQCLIDVGREEESLDPLMAWLNLKTNPPLQAVKSLAAMHLTYERYEQAEQLWKRVYKIDPGSSDAPAALSYISEISNDKTAAAQYADAALQLNNKNALARLTKAQLALRDSKPDEAIETLTSLLDESGLASVNRSLALYRLAKAYDLKKNYREAWKAAARAGQTLSVQVKPSPSTYSLPAIAELQNHFESFNYETWGRSHPSDGHKDPVFLVGFPRSGTTLTERMLSSHTEISCVEEQDTLGPILAQFVAGPEALAALDDLTNADVNYWRQKYFREVAKHANISRVIVDKMPMDSIYLALIYRFFPNSKIIFALRDPRDVVVSCFMQSFALNEAMRHFLSIDDTTRYYAASMRLATSYLDTVPLNVRLHRYEDLVQDTENQAKALFAFLGMPWNPSVLDYHSRSSDTVINTPSYAQVDKPIYTGSMARWKGYLEHLSPYLHRLDPYIRRFGYANE